MENTFFYVLPLSLIYLTWSIWTGRPLLSFPLSVISFLPAASFSTLIEIWTGFDSNLSVLVISVIVVATALVGRRTSLVSSVGLYAAIGASFVAALSFTSTYLSKSFGLSSIGFTDGHTILVRAIEFGNGDPSIESGVKALKRGFGISAIHAQGEPSEYLVGFMPVIFIAVLFATGLLVYEISGDRFSSVVVPIVILTLSGIVEAIGRHIWLINSHSFLWLAFTLLLLFFYESARRERISSALSFSILVIFSAIGFLRVDAILISLPLTLLLLNQANRFSYKLAYAIIPVQAVSAFLWIITVTDEFPLFATLGPYLFLVAGLMISLAFVKLRSLQKFSSDILGKRPFWYLAGGFLLYSIFAIDYGSTFESLILNLLLGQGLWGALPYLVGIGAVLALIFHKKLLTSEDRVAISAIALSIMIFFVVKSWDSLDSGVLYGAVVRTGFGDSFNRNLISWTPLVVIMVSIAIRASVSKSKQNGR